MIDLTNDETYYENTLKPSNSDQLDGDGPPLELENLKTLRGVNSNN